MQPICLFMQPTDAVYTDLAMLVKLAQYPEE